MQIPILRGIKTDSAPDFRETYPLNMVPVVGPNGISDGYLRPVEGISERSEGAGLCRGGIVWKGDVYMVLGSTLTRLDGAGNLTAIGDVGSNANRASLTYSFDHLAVASGNDLFLFDGTFTQVTDGDLGNVKDVTWTGGYFVFTDGEFIGVTDIDDPFSVSALKYGSSEASPDEILSVKRLRNEIYAINRYTIEVFQNIGGSGFPFSRIEGAQIEKGSVGKDASAIFLEQIAFVGGGENEAPAVWVSAGGTQQKISTDEIDRQLSTVSDSDLSKVFMNVRQFDGRTHLYIHLPNVTLVYDAAASAALDRPVWFRLSSSLDESEGFRASVMLWANNDWWVGDTRSGKVGVLDKTEKLQWGERIKWEFGAPILYNEGNGALIHELELVALTGRVELGDDPIISTDYSTDGETWSQPRTIKAGKIGDRAKRLVWLNQGPMGNIRMQRFYGTSDAHVSFARLEAQVSPLAF